MLVGPSGCGKSTLLRLIAGLETPTSGRVFIGGADVTERAAAGTRPGDGLSELRALSAHERARQPRVRLESAPDRSGGRDASASPSVAAALDLEELLDRRPAQLSGGQRQRVALGRAMVRQPQAFLLDEPLSNLDPALRAQARAELRRLHRRLGVTVVYVTHDQEEAMTLGGRVAVMRDGVIEQVAPPLEVYARPVNTFVARFIGAPPMNLVSRRRWSAIDAPPGALAGIRPQDVTLCDGGGLQAIVELVEPRGHDHLVHLRLDAPGSDPFLVVVAGSTPPPVGAGVFLSLPQERLHLFEGRGGMRVV